jgi:hypothetical protein
MPLNQGYFSFVEFAEILLSVFTFRYIAFGLPVESVELYNLAGNKVTGDIYLPGESGKFNIETGKLAKGFYLLNSITKSGS